MKADLKTRLADAIYGELDVEDGDHYGGYGTPAVHEVKLTGLEAAVDAALAVLREDGAILPELPDGWRFDNAFGGKDGHDFAVGISNRHGVFRIGTGDTLPGAFAAAIRALEGLADETG